MGVEGARSSDEPNAIAAEAKARLQGQDGQDLCPAKASVLESLARGVDTQLYAAAGSGRTALYGAWLSAVGGKSLIVCGGAEEAEKIVSSVRTFGVVATVATAAEDLKGAFTSENACVVSCPAAVAAFLKTKTASIVVDRCVVDSVDSIISHGPLSDLESCLLSFRDFNPEAQIVLIGSEPSLNISALSRRFLREPQTCSIKGVTVQNMEHVYYEVETSLLAKPQALCDLVELEGGSPCIVFCNSPSDADFADVILRKRGVASMKLIGYVPQLKLSKALQQLQKKEITTLVLTDVAARGISLEDFAVVVNYSVPTDPEVYFHRYSASPESQTKKVISLVAALDISNFHYLKKLGKLEFIQGELPAPEQLFLGKFGQLKEQAIEKALVNDSGIAAMVDKILADEKARDIAALLVFNTLSVIPSLKAAASAREEAQEYEEEDEDDQQPQPGDRRRGRGQQGRDRDRDSRDSRDSRGSRDSRDSRGGRGDRRGGRSQDRGFDSYGQEGDGYEAHSDEGHQGRRGGRRGGDGERGDRGGDSRERQQRPPRKPMIVDKEARLYVGVGKNHGVSDAALTQDVVSLCGVEASDVHRVSVREFYSFIDVPEAVANQVIDKLGEHQAASTGEKYFVKKAVTLSIPREGTPDEASSSDDGGSYEEHEMAHTSRNEGVDDGPTMLSVDDQP